MSEQDPALRKMPEGDERMAALGLLAHLRYQQIPARQTGELGVTAYEPIFSRVCSRGVRFEDLDPVFQREFLAEAGISPEFAQVATPLLPAIRAVTAAVEQDVDIDRIIATVRETDAA